MSTATPPPSRSPRPTGLTWAWTWVAFLVLGLVCLAQFTPQPYRLGAGWAILAGFLLLPLMMFYDFERRANNRVVLLPGASRLRPAMRQLKLGNPVWTVLLRMSVIALLILGAARPQQAAGEEKSVSEGIDIVLTLDVSGSMLANDMLPDRLTVAKRVVGDFVAQQTSNRLGLVAFAGRSLTQTPITTDYAVVKAAVDNLSIRTVWFNGTAIGDAIGSSINKFKDPKAKSKVIILLTDGENNEGSLDPRDAAKFAQERGIRIYCIGVGTPEGVVLQDPLGRTYITRLDIPLMEEIAARTMGRFFLATDERALRAAYAEIARLEKHEVEVHTSKRYTELFPWVALPAFLLLLLEVGLGATRYRSFV